MNVPLFSLHSKESCGIGEFPDLLPLVPWCRSLGFTILQLLPLNDSGIDSSPYSAISAYALNPLHLGLKRLPRALPLFKPIGQQPRIDYKAVREARESFLQSYFAQEFPVIGRTESYRQFCAENSWLKGYALFKTLKEKRQWQPWRLWPVELASPSSATLTELYALYAEAIDYHSFIQYLCFTQLQEVKRLANGAGVFLKGDIPICLSAESADVWLNPHMFLKGLTVGAPPDMYNPEGQNWGFPVYDWERLKKEDFGWWRRRLAVATPLYDLYRVDHIVGLFRFWVIPEGASAKGGYFLPVKKEEWLAQGERILRLLLESSPMLPIGEDLGTIPPEVRLCMHRLGVCGTKVMRWERMWKEDGRYIPIRSYPSDSLTTVSTHDSETLALWWRNQTEEVERLVQARRWLETKEMTPEVRYALLRESHLSTSLFHINLLNEYLALVPELIWPDPEMERINRPGVVSDENWTYRFRPSVEEIVSHRELALVLKSLIPLNSQHL